MITRKSLMDKVYRKSGGVLTSAYGTPRDGGTRKHAGEDWDIAGTETPKVYAPFNCIVISVKESMTNDRGKDVEILIGKKYLWFQHMYDCTVTKGQRLAAGHQMGIQGGSGKTLWAYKSHIHMELANYPMGDSRRVALNPNIYFYPLFSAPKYAVKTVVVSDLNIRKGHSIDSVDTKKNMPLGPCTIYEQVLEDGYIWGRIDWVADLWIALRTADGKKVYAK